MSVLSSRAEARVGELDINSSWMHIVTLLSGKGSPHEQISAAGDRGNARRGLDIRWPEDVQIRILERLSDHTVSLAWGHPCRGHFGCQTWQRTTARTCGICSLTGERVLQGEQIYKLVRSASGVRRINEMLLARHVDAILECSDRM
ncbi:DUF3331 domain-containing protein [Burkholderia contaminans]|nr:DUF3331 domain-containing protein [Burkholderia contaminans]MBA9928152.1 DUF3331 domain-containing protein [Burkholderia contaminans]RDT05544.1 DUF3331 domain-containing protein [Burkholderia contaminans]